MSRMMSFSMTTEQVRRGQKTVTRRLGWKNLRSGELLWAVETAQGLRKGEQVKRIRIIRVVSVRREPLDYLLPSEWGYTLPDAWLECVREGFPELSPEGFVAMFCKAHRCKPDVTVTRVEFGYVDLERVP